MEGRDLLHGEETLPGEVVNYYYQPDLRQVVETYSRPLPGQAAASREEKASPALPKRRKKTGLWVFLLCCAVAAGFAVGGYFWTQNQEKEVIWDPFDYYFEEPGDSITQEISIPRYPTGEEAALEMATDHGRELTTQEVYSRVNPSVVTVIVQLGEQGASVGTGVIFRSDGYILTNYHVLEGGRDCTVALDSGRSYEAKYVAGDQENDLAVLKVDAEGLPAAEFGDSDQLVVGDTVYAIGNPLGVELRGTLTDGIVSAINRDVEVDGRTMNLIQTNAALNSGNSGGPLINVYGQVVGINTIKMSSSYSNIEGLGFAIPSASIYYLVNDLLSYGEVQPEPVLGVSVMYVGTQVEEGLWGVEVDSVTTGFAAWRAGVQAGDVILTAGGQPITSSRDLMRVRRQYEVGDQLPMTLWRDGEVLDVVLNLQESTEDLE